MICKFILSFKRPIRLGSEIIQTIGPFDTIQDASVYYSQMLKETHPDMKQSVLDCQIDSIHNPNNL